jgi:hypothetical protein
MELNKILDLLIGLVLISSPVFFIILAIKVSNAKYLYISIFYGIIFTIWILKEMFSKSKYDNRWKD